MLMRMKMGRMTMMMKNPIHLPHTAGNNRILDDEFGDYDDDDAKMERGRGG